MGRDRSQSRIEDDDLIPNKIGHLQHTFRSDGVKGILKQLKVGNIRFMNDTPDHPRRCTEMRIAVVTQQNPVAAIIACSDSRVPVEIIFDVGIGDVFVVRTAGHVLSESSLASLEYAIQVLKVKLVIILGHAACGAVHATFHTTEEVKKGYTSNLLHLVEQIEPAVQEAREYFWSNQENDIIEAAIDIHVDNTIDLLHDKMDAILKQNMVTLIGAKYNLKTGYVEFFDHHIYSSPNDSKEMEGLLG